ncbi:MAG: cytochrome c3 family protein [Desulfovibrionaceae bacterium]
MKKHLSITLLLAAAVLLFLLPAFAQEMTQLLDPAFKDHQRPGAVFAHDEHNEKAGIDECNGCHHVYAGKRWLPDDDSVGIPCADCHKVDGASHAAHGDEEAEGLSDIPLRLAYHKQCIECHEDAIAAMDDAEAEAEADGETVEAEPVNAPLTCGECHVRQ